jgi:hypothetical protein
MANDLLMGFSALFLRLFLLLSFFLFSPFPLFSPFSSPLFIKLSPAWKKQACGNFLDEQV